MSAESASSPDQPRSPRHGPLVLWSVGLDGAFVLFLVLFFLLVASGQRGGATFFSNPALSVTLLLAAGSALIGGILAIIALWRPRDRSFVLLLPICLGLLVSWWTLAELLGHD